MAGVSMIFDLSGLVKDNHGATVPNHGMKAVLDYYQFIGGGDSQLQTQTVTFDTDGNGNYTYTFPGPGSPLLNWDQSKKFGATVSNTESGWRTYVAGQFANYLPGDSPRPVPISDTGLMQTMALVEDAFEDLMVIRRREATGLPTER